MTDKQLDAVNRLPEASSIEAIREEKLIALRRREAADDGGRSASHEEVEKPVAEVNQWADADAVDLMHTREIEQDVLDLLDEN